MRLSITVDWDKVPVGNRSARIIVSGSQASVPIVAPLFKLDPSTRIQKGAFLESQGCVSIEAEHFLRAVGDRDIRWVVLPEHGLTLSAVTPFPVTASSVTPGPGTPHLEYLVHLFSRGEASVTLHFSPTLNFQPGRSLRAAVSFDDEAPKLIDILAPNKTADWERSVIDGVRKTVSKHAIKKAGTHVLKVWMVDPAVVLQKLIVDMGSPRPSALGPNESPRF